MFSPKVFNYAGGAPVNLALSVSSAMLVKGGFDSMTAKLQATASYAMDYAKKNPTKALLMGATAAATVYYGTPYLSDAITHLGNMAPIKKAVVDHGSGAIKASMKEINPFTGTVLSTVELGKEAVSISKGISEVDGVKHISKEAMEKGVEAVKKLVKAAKEAGVSDRNITGVATAWVRSGADNISTYLGSLNDSAGIGFHAVSQDTEGALAKLAVERAGESAAKVLDTGGGSLQLVHDGMVYGTETASETFMQSAKKTFTNLGVSDHMWKKAEFSTLTDLAHKMTAAKNTANLSIMPTGVGEVVGIGNVYNGLAKVMKSLKIVDTLTITPESIDKLIQELSRKTTEQIGEIVASVGIPKSIAANIATNVALVKGVMETFGINTIKAVDANSGAAAFFLPQFWTNASLETSKAAMDFVGILSVTTSTNQSIATR